MGRTHRPFYRLNAVDKRTQRDGKIIENLGWFDPVAKDESKQVELKVDRIKHWLSVGAQPSDTVADLLAKHDIIDPEKRKAERHARVKTKIEKMEADKAAAEAKAKEEAEAKAKAEAEAAAAAAAEAKSSEGESAEAEGDEG
jgi:small subunit ribosomal protein S16